MGTESLPQGIIAKTSNLETQHLWNYDDNEKVVQVNFVTIFTPSYYYYYYYFCSLLFCCCVPFLCLFSGESEPPWNELVSYGCWNQAKGASQQTHPKGFVFVFFLIIVFVLCCQ